MRRAPFADNMRVMHQRIVRIALTLVLLAATQVAIAGQLCSSVMARDMPVGQSGRGYDAMAAGAVVVADLQPCCGSAPMPATTCVTAVDGVGWTAAAPNGNSPPAVAAPPPSAYATVMGLERSPTSAFRAATAVGPPLPAYIRLRRFLS